MDKKNKNKQGNKIYSLEEGITFLKENYKPRFEETVELHFHLGIDVKQTMQNVRGSITLPYGPIKPKKIALFVSPGYLGLAKKTGADIVGGQELIEEINEKKKINFDIAIAEPGIMKDLAKIARLLGPKGLMPSPKSGTITTNLKETVDNFKKGQLNFRNDETGNIHLAIGKISWPKEHILANAQAVIQAVLKARPPKVKGSYIKSLTLCSTMSPGLKISL